MYMKKHNPVETHLRWLQMKNVVFMEKSNLDWQIHVKGNLLMKTSQREDQCAVISV